MDELDIFAPGTEPENQDQNMDKLITYFTSFSGHRKLFIERFDFIDNLKCKEICPNCQRDMLTTNFNTPFVSPCGHSFCDMCISTERQISCHPCKMEIGYFVASKTNFIENKQLISLSESYMKKYGNEINLDFELRRLRRLFTEKVRRIFAYLPLWNSHFAKGKCLQMTLGFLEEEKKAAQDRMKILSSSLMLLNEVSLLSNLMKKIDHTIKRQTEIWTKVINEHKQGFEDFPKVLCTRLLDVKPVFEKFDNLYLSTCINGKTFYLKLSGDCENILVHSGFWASSVEKNFANNNKLFATSLRLDQFTVVFMDITFMTNVKEAPAVTVEKKHSHRVYIRLEKVRNNFVERIFSLFTGQSKSLKGTAIKKSGNSVLIFSEPEGLPYLFSVPSTDIVQDIINLDDMSPSFVIGCKTADTAKIVIVIDQKKFPIKGNRFYFGKIESGIDFLKEYGLQSVKGFVEDCGVVIPWKVL